MKNEEHEGRICPICGATYHGAPAISRVDNKTPICPDCGTRQSLSAMGVRVEEQERILAAIHRSTGTEVES